jgi:restriction system protein
MLTLHNAPISRLELPGLDLNHSEIESGSAKFDLNANMQEIKSRLIAELRDLTPRASEHSCKEFLAHLGYRSVEVTRQSQDGGIDGHGDFRQGAISIRSAFQSKRWTDNPVGRPDIDRFRGAIQGEYDHGVFLTTSRFSKDAMEASYKKGAITILLLDGPAIADLLVERGLGVRRRRSTCWISTRSSLTLRTSKVEFE